MEIVLPIIIPCAICFIYLILFVKAGEQPIFAIIPILNKYTLCKIVDAQWAFWGYVIAVVLRVVFSVTGSPILVLLIGVAMVVINIIVYIRLLVACRNEIFWAIALIALEIISLFV